MSDMKLVFSTSTRFLFFVGGFLYAGNFDVGYVFCQVKLELFQYAYTKIERVHWKLTRKSHGGTSTMNQRYTILKARFAELANIDFIITSFCFCNLKV